MTNKYIAYYRVSTAKQGQSGLGLEAQRKTVEAFCRDGIILAEYTDIESGKNNSRPELAKAIAHAKTHDALLVIAKLDRLSRNVYFISSLLESRIRFKACDIPQADHFTVHLFAALAQKEREMISERTKAALAAKKAQGYRLGSPQNMTAEARAKAVASIIQNAESHTNNIKATTVIRLLRGQQLSFRQIAAELNRAGFQTRYGKTFEAMTVKRLYDRDKTIA